MLRRLPLLIIAIAALLAAEPLIHSHPLWENSDARSAFGNGTCAVCAATSSQLPTTAPTIAAPVVIIGTVPATSVAAAPAVAAPSLSSRAPPAA